MSNVIPFERGVDDAQNRIRSLTKSDIANGGGGGNNGGMEPRIAKLEATTEYIQREISDIKTDIKGIRAELKSEVEALRSEINSIRTTDFRILFGAIIAVALGLSGIMAKGFGWL